MEQLKALEEYKQLSINYQEIREIMKNHLNKINNNFIKVKVTAEDVIYVLKKFKEGAIKKNDLLNWVNFIWFSDFYYYEETQENCIADVLTELEQGDEDEKYLSLPLINKYIHALCNNIEL